MASNKWLVTVNAGQVAEATESLRRLGCEVSAEAAVPVDGDTVLPVSAPEECTTKLKEQPGVKAVHPDSEITLYRD